jgi:isoquinoline 1-oxidoreductase alpha subunit
MAFEFLINGRSAKVDVPAGMPLLWVIRDVLDLRGTKFGCGMGLCGACTVHINGNAARSCITDIATVVGKEVRTIEGLSSDGTHPVQIEWQEIDVPQCGYCQAGQIMSAVALLGKTPQPTDSQISEAMDVTHRREIAAGAGAGNNVAAASLPCTGPLSQADNGIQDYVSN